jgi:hypothetical protein
MSDDWRDLASLKRAKATGPAVMTGKIATYSEDARSVNVGARMNIDRKTLGGVLIAAALLVFFFWYMSPYERCVRAATESATQHEIRLRDSRGFNRYSVEDRKSDDVIRDEQNLYARMNCLDNSD